MEEYFLHYQYYSVLLMLETGRCIQIAENSKQLPFIYETRRGSVYQMCFTTLGDVRLLGHWIQSWESWLNWI